jgi:hypothetical protein
MIEIIIKHMKNILHTIVDHFGFENFHDFSTSLVHFNLLKITIPMGGIMAGTAALLGFTNGMLAAFIVMVIFELVSGVWASVVEGRRIESRKFSRFGFKLLTWLVLIYITYAFSFTYSNKGVVIAWFTSAFYETIIGYILWEYVVSIVENMERITRREIPLKKYLNGLLDKFITKH